MNATTRETTNTPTIAAAGVQRRSPSAVAVTAPAWYRRSRLTEPRAAADIGGLTHPPHSVRLVPLQIVRRVLGARFSKYTMGSVVAFAVSEVTLLVAFGTGLVGAAVASVLAFIAGAIPNYFLNRSWVWDRHGRIDVRNELVPYVLVSLTTLGVAALATSTAAAAAPAEHQAQTLFVGVAYLLTYATLFVTKFSVYHRLIFRNDSAQEDTR
jgi:putative flippase GtrA